MEPSGRTQPVPRSVPREWAKKPWDRSAPPAACSTAAVKAAMGPSLTHRTGPPGTV